MKYYTVNEIAEKYSKNPETVRRWIRSGELKAIQHSKKSGNFVSEYELEKFISTHKKSSLSNVKLHLDNHPEEEPIICWNGKSKHISELSITERYTLVALLRSRT